MVTENHQLFIDVTKSQLPQSIFSHARLIKERTATKRNAIWQAFLNYEQSAGLLSFAELNGLTLDKKVTRPVKYNIFKNIVDTLVSKIAKNRVRVTFLPTNGSYEAREKSKNQTLALDALFDLIGYHEVKQATFRDALICGTGVTKVVKDLESGLIKAERVFPLELLVDELDGMYGNPTFCYHVKVLPKKTVAEMFNVPENDLDSAETWAIDLLAKTYSLRQINTLSMRNTVAVIEAYHRAVGNKKGRHVITTSNKVLLDEEYDHDFLPFSFEKFSDASLGFWGNGVWDEISSIQLEIDEIANRIKESINIGSSFKVAIEEGSEVKRQSLTNQIGQIITYRGQPPLFIAPQTVSAEVYNYLSSLIERAYNVVGLSQLSAQSQKPAGLNAAVALREYQDIESERFHILAKKRESLIVTDAKKILLLYAAWNDSSKVKLPVTNRLGVIKFLTAKDVAKDAEQFIIRPYPTSLLPQTPQGRLQTVMELFQSGLLTVEQFWEMLDVPDTERLMSRSASTVKLVNMQLEHMMRTKEYSAPDPLYSINEALKAAMAFYLDAKYNQFEEERLELIRQYIAQLQTYSDYVKEGEQMVAQAQALLLQQNQQGGMNG